MLDALAGADACQDVRLLVGAIGQHKPRNRFADDLPGGIAEQPFGSAVPAGDGAIEILGEDRIGRRLDDSCQALGGFVGDANSRGRCFYKPSGS